LESEAAFSTVVHIRPGDPAADELLKESAAGVDVVEAAPLPKDR
jgi:hypothetical protein